MVVICKYEPVSLTSPAVMSRNETIQNEKKKSIFFLHSLLELSLNAKKRRVLTSVSVRSSVMSNE